jgi:hypothetical protein
MMEAQADTVGLASGREGKRRFDSVPEGPGTSDNGSGSAAVFVAALAARPPSSAVAAQNRPTKAPSEHPVHDTQVKRLQKSGLFAVGTSE